MAHPTGPRPTRPPVAEADRVSLTIGEFTRRGVLWEHGAGMLLTSILFLTDAHRHAFNTSKTYTLVHNVPGGPYAWSLWPLTAALLLLFGMTGNRWRYALTGLIGLSVWYGAQTALVICGWNSAGRVGLLGPVGVYGLVLLPKAVTHAVSVTLNGRRWDRAHD